MNNHIYSRSKEWLLSDFSNGNFAVHTSAINEKASHGKTSGTFLNVTRARR